MDRLALAGALAVAAVALAWLLQRRRSGAQPFVPRAEIPTRVDLSALEELLPDDVPAEAGALIVVFTEETCRTCASALERAREAALLAAARSAAGSGAPVVEVPFGARAEVHRAHGIDTVPTTVVVNRSGNVIDGWVGTVVAAELAEAVAQARA